MSPRELEATILIKAAAQFQQAQESWGDRGQLKDALSYNRKLWAIFVANATDPESPLPLNLRNNIANLGIFVFKRTQEVLAEPAPEKLNILMSINRELASGLRS
ncbi:MAG: flagellar biosynthesis regulator FlaF [Pseudomonadota bacterium]